MDDQHFPVDLADPEDVAAKLPRIAALLRGKRQELQALERQVELLERLVGPDEERPARAAANGAVNAKKRKSPGAPSQDRAVEALNRAGRQMGPASLYKFMQEQGMELPPTSNALGASLYAAWKAGRVKRATNGVYAPHDGTGSTTIDHPIQDYDALPPDSPFPRPAARPLGSPVGGDASEP